MKTNTKYLTLNAILIALAISIQLVGRSIPSVSQGFVGPFINAILIVSLLFTNVKYASMVAIITPITALLTAQLNPAMGFFVPFICLGNVIFVILFSIVNIGKNPWILNGLKLLFAALGKYLLLSLSATKVIVWLNLGVNAKILDKLAIAMGLPQLYTALVGGIIGIFIYKLIKPRLHSFTE